VLPTLTYQDFPSVETTNKGANNIMTYDDVLDYLSHSFNFVDCLKEDIKVMEIALFILKKRDESTVEETFKRIELLLTLFSQSSTCHLEELETNLEFLGDFLLGESVPTSS
jgi:hypothetical protein